MTAQALEIHVFGVVQGVGFRWFVQREARKLGLVGWVRNEPDGSVKIVAEGEAGLLAELVKTVRRGNSWSHVTKVDAKPIPWTGRYQDFTIRY